MRWRMNWAVIWRDYTIEMDKGDEFEIRVLARSYIAVVARIGGGNDFGYWVEEEGDDLDSELESSKGQFM